MTISHKLEDKKQSFLNIFWKKKKHPKDLKILLCAVDKRNSKNIRMTQNFK